MATQERLDYSREYSKQYYLKNKVKWSGTYSKVQYEKYTCACGKTVMRQQLRCHQASKLHFKNLSLKELQQRESVKRALDVEAIAIVPSVSVKLSFD